MSGRIVIEYGSDREILIALVNQQAEMVEDIREIKEQTKKTNGRVTGLENWRNYLVGAWAVITIIAVVIGTVLFH